MNIFSTLTSVWDWIKNHALQQLVITIALLVLSFITLLKYPVSIDVSRKTIRDYIETTETVNYIVRTELTEKGAIIDFCTNTYYGEVKHLEEVAK
jgi:hypothetical protein